MMPNASVLDLTIMSKSPNLHGSITTNSHPKSRSDADPVFVNEVVVALRTIQGSLELGRERCIKENSL